ncbi:PMS1 protein homolog 1 isoform X2 [Varanus komodoensis]|uniref:PMS1 homolog 1, mismatch repair system component n=1 Tax=Varanus komodoensis TaxID=61221 RepID=A0A8D2IS40_VARKO|nr:PMS1 protein homolog 1 isoform X2 [Varanus komodoensis]
MKQLPPDTVRLLSSSQVITSVVSVVKELIENSLDANATSVDVKLEGYGFDKIEVRDNGDGIKAADVPVMAMKHYTSKISSSEDLENLTMYGFRGEALGSICSTSEVLITTKTAADDFSTQYSLDKSGHVISQKPSHLGQGTTVTVLKLFKNLPVRKQFYSTDKKCKEEIKKIQKLLMAYGIIKPELRIIFIHNKTVIWQKTRVSDHKMAFMAVVGTAVMGSMVPFQRCGQDPEVLISGFLPKPDSDGCLTSHSNSERSFIFVNYRPVYQKEILKESICLAIEDILTSVYGPLTEATSCETDITDAILEDIFANGMEQMISPINEMESCSDINPHTCMPLASLNKDVQNGETEKNADISLKNQTLCHNSSGDLPGEIEISSNEMVGYDRFQDGTLNNFLSQDEQSMSKEVFNLDSRTFINPYSKNSIKGDLRNDSFQEAEKREGAIIPKDSSEVTADKWSMGNAFKNSREENLEPIQILIPGMKEARPQKKNDVDNQQKLQEENNQSIKASNVVNNKVGQITAYDLIRNQTIRKPMSAFALFTQDHRLGLLTENIKISTEELMLKLEEMWKMLSEEAKKKYEEKAERDLERYNRQSEDAMIQSLQKSTKGKERRHKVRLKDSLSQQEKLDKLFHSQAEKKHNNRQAIKIVHVPFSMDTLKHKLDFLEQKESDKDERCLLQLLNFPEAWIIASEKEVTVLNPYRVEEALLFKRLLENHKLPTEQLDKPIALTDSLFSGCHYMEVLCNMTKDSVRFDGSCYLLDSRLVANGFKIKMIPGASATEHQLEIEGMTKCVPYYGVSDLKEILNAVINNNAKEVYECRPLKVVNYLEGEAVRLSRQLPLYLSKEDVQDTICRMEKQLGNQHKGCVHGRPFIHYLTDIPQKN